MELWILLFGAICVVKLLFRCDWQISFLNLFPTNLFHVTFEFWAVGNIFTLKQNWRNCWPPIPLTAGRQTNRTKSTSTFNLKFYSILNLLNICLLCFFFSSWKNIENILNMVLDQTYHYSGSNINMKLIMYKIFDFIASWCSSS